ncbi:MAG: PDZ domain-containing protein [Spirochaetales bacterium]|nr:PDZ domain-containing protein [Spirochaetales bacterium]
MGRTIVKPFFFTFLLFAAAVFSTCKKPVQTAPARPSGPGYLGILYVPNSDGLRILRVYPESPATRAGLAVGDTITAVEGQSALRLGDFRARIRARREGEKVNLDIMSVSGARRKVVATINEIPSALDASY